MALVTGASSGIGEATARALAAEGAAVAVAARGAATGSRRSAGEIEGAGGRALVLEADVTSREAAVDAVERTVAGLGRLDTVINNAGVMLLGPIEDAPLEEWERMVALNVNGLLYVAHAALPHLLHAAASEPRGGWRTSSNVSLGRRPLRPAAGSGVYNATKFGVGVFSESLRQEVTERFVRIALVEPGAVATELSSHVREEIREQLQRAFDSLERLEAADIADAIAYVVTRRRTVAVNEVLIRPTQQVR